MLKYNYRQELYYQELADSIVNEIKEWFDKNAPKAKAVIGISGGKDSTIAAALLVRALGKDRVVGVLMPNIKQDDISDSYKVVRILDIESVVVNIGAACENLMAAYHGDITDNAFINLPPRIRMATLYMVAQSQPEGGIVINTCNFSEDYVGYSTKFGDSAGDFSVLGNFLVSEVIKIGEVLPELPWELVHKTPSDGLCGKSDEDNLGFTYDDLEIHMKMGSCGDTKKDTKISQLHQSTRHKYKPMYMCGCDPVYP